MGHSPLSNGRASATRNKPAVHLDPGKKDNAAHVLARAFQDYPLYRYVVPDDQKRARELPWLMGKVIAYSLLYGETYSTLAVEGVACWLPPGRTEITVGRVMRTGLYAVLPRFGLAACGRFIGSMAYADKVHRRHAPEPHWYLWTLGVDPVHQGMGLGGELIRPVLSVARAAGVPCYLETHSEWVVRFYEKHGFTIVSEGRMRRHGLALWAMRLEP